MFCFRLSFFPRGVGPGGLRAGQPGRATGPGGWLLAGRASGRATGSGGWLRAGRANHLFNWRLGPVSPPVVQLVLHPVVQSSLQTVVQPSLQPKQSLVFNRFFSRSKVRSFNRSSNRRKVRSSTAPPTDAKFGPSTCGSILPSTDAKFGPSTAPSTDAPDSHANAPQPKSQTMQRDSGRTTSAILKNLCEVTHFYT